MTTAAPPIIPAPNRSAGTPRDDHQEDPKHSGTRRHHCRDPGQDVRRHLNTSSAGLLGESVLGTVSTQAGTGWVLLDWFVVMLGRGGCRCGPTDPMRRGRRTLRG